MGNGGKKGKEKDTRAVVRRGAVNNCQLPCNNSGKGLLVIMYEQASESSPQNETTVRKLNKSGQQSFQDSGNESKADNKQRNFLKNSSNLG